MRRLILIALTVILVGSGCGNKQSTEPQVTFKGATIDPAMGSDSENNLRNLAVALLMYCQDYEQAMPPALDLASAQQYLDPYTKNPALWVDPQTQQTYGSNPALAGKSMESIAGPDQIVVFYETVPRQQGFRAVAFLDGHVARVQESQWPRVRQLSGIP